MAGCSQTPTPARQWLSVKSFACQFQEVQLQQLAHSPFDLLVIDYSSDGHALGAYRPEQLKQLRRPGRYLVAYLSLGEAESYRYYWKPSWKPDHPTWLGPTNPDWGGNYKVRYWDPAWKKIVLDYTAQVVAQGFDGVFLDVVDAYEYWQASRPQAAQEMTELVLGVADFARERAGRDFGIFLNGGQGLISDARLLHCITGVAKEEVFFGLHGDGNSTPPELQAQWKKELATLVNAQKLVLSIDYTKDPKQMHRAHLEAQKAGFLEYVGVRNLDRLVEQPTPEPRG